MWRFYLLVLYLIFLTTCSVREFTPFTKDPKSLENQIILKNKDINTPLISDNLLLEADILASKNIKSIKIISPQLSTWYEINGDTKSYSISQMINLSNNKGSLDDINKYPVEISFTDSDYNTINSNFTFFIGVRSVHFNISIPERPATGFPWLGAGDIVIQISDTGAKAQKITIKNTSCGIVKDIPVKPNVQVYSIKVGLITTGSVAAGDYKSYKIEFISIHNETNEFLFKI
ncbi:MAG: hypothetical protein ACRCVW_00950 [Brevinema sp.]